MPRPPSPATLRALELVREGAKPFAAAKECGIAPNTMYLALARQREQQPKNTRPSRRSKR